MRDRWMSIQRRALGHTREVKKEWMKAGVLSPPAIRINDRMVASGRVPRVPDLVNWLVEAGARST